MTESTISNHWGMAALLRPSGSQSLSQIGVQGVYRTAPASLGLLNKLGSPQAMLTCGAASKRNF